MIFISNGLLPDLNGGEMNGLNEETVKNDEPIIKFSYDNTLDEIDGAMKASRPGSRARGTYSPLWRIRC